MGMTPEEFLEHYGVKGMKWGVVKKDESSGRDSGGPVSLGALAKGKPETEQDRANQLKAKYGNDSMKDIPPVPPQKQRGWNSLSDTQKQIIIGAGGVAVAGGLLYLYGRSAETRRLAQLPTAAELSARRIQDLSDLADMQPGDISVGLRAHWDTGVDLKPGHILQRLSTVQETEIRPKGFFAAFDPEDVERYKGQLPGWWKKWGGQYALAKDGYLTQIEAQTAVKAPSGRETLEILKSVYDDDSVLANLVGGPGLLAMTPDVRTKVVEGAAKGGFEHFVMNFADGYDQDPHVQKFFQLVKDRGYNAVIDFNDSGRLAKTPLRLLDGADFKIVGNKLVPRMELDQAAVDLKELVMAALDRVGSFLEHHGLVSRANVFLEHYGVKGMKWGVRRAEKKWEKKVVKTQTNFMRSMDVYNEVAGRMNNGLTEKFNNSPKYKDLDIRKRNAKNAKEFDAYYDAYLRDYMKLMDSVADDVAREKYGVSPSGTRKAVIDRSIEGNYVLKIVPNDAQHAAGDLEFQLIQDETGKFVKILPRNMAQTSVVGDFLEHYGVKGMRWGVRRDRTPKPRVVSSDAKRVEKIEVKTRTKGQRSLTNKELNDFNKRLQLEKTQRSFIDLDPRGKKIAMAGAAFITGIAATVGREIVKETVKNNASKKVAAVLAKKAAEEAGAT